MALAYHCDREGCDTWQKIPNTNPLWLILTSPASALPENHFCTLDCLMHWAAEKSEPTETIPL